jgi:hypothetical protein
MIGFGRTLWEWMGGSLLLGKYLFWLAAYCIEVRNLGMGNTIEIITCLCLSLGVVVVLVSDRITSLSLHCVFGLPCWLGFATTTYTR